MNKDLRAASYLIAANFEVIVLIIGAWEIAKWANEKYPISFSWLMVTMPIAVIIIIKSWYVFFNEILKKDKEDK